MTYVILFVFGAIVGSFLNVVGLRMNAGMTLGGRSYCPSCGKKLKWRELVPVLSFISLQGKCSSCKARISWQYPLIEIFTGIVFASIAYTLAPPDGWNLLPTTYYLLLILVFSIYIVILIYDLRHKIIPDRLVYSAILLSVVSCWLSSGPTLDWLAGPIIFLFFASIWLLSRGRAMGFGDAKLGLSVGLLLGASTSFSAIILAFWIGAATALIYMLFSVKKLTMKSEIPFAPFIILGAWLSLILNLDLLHVTLF